MNIPGIAVSCQVSAEIGNAALFPVWVRQMNRGRGSPELGSLEQNAKSESLPVVRTEMQTHPLLL